MIENLLQPEDYEELQHSIRIQRLVQILPAFADEKILCAVAAIRHSIRLLAITFGKSIDSATELIAEIRAGKRSIRRQVVIPPGDTQL